MSMFNFPLLNYVRGFQSKIMQKPVEHANLNLAIQEGERLHHMSSVKYPNIVKMSATVPDLSSEAYERTQIDGYSTPLKDTDFQHTGQLGGTTWE